jgi:16S rRNA pseudouridine516 synthase
MERLDRLLSNLGYCTRKESRELLRAGIVTVNREEASDPGMKVRSSDVRFDGQPLDHADGILIAFNKPVGVVCSKSSNEGPTVYEYLPEQWLRRNPEVATVGRLDKDTSGLVLITDQGVLAHRLSSPKGHVPKLYRVIVDRDLSTDLVGLFAAGNLLLEGETEPCAPAELKIVGTKEAELTLYEGRNRQIRRMFASQGYMVTSLRREKMGDLELGDIAEGEWRDLPIDYFDILSRGMK